jgi:hypothetical protein
MKSTKTKIMSRFIGIFPLIAYYCISCSPESEEIGILIQNRTDAEIHIKLYPNDKYFASMATNIVHGCRDTFSLHPYVDHKSKSDELLFEVCTPNTEPNLLVTRAIDSICISTANNEIIKFMHDTVNGYSENIFSDNSTWDYATGTFRQAGYKIIAHSYTFLILEDKIIIE